MGSLTSTNGGWLRKITASRMIPCLLAQVLIVSFCIPQTLESGKEIRREMTWEELPAFLESENKVTIMLIEGGAVRSDRVTALSDSVHLGRITKATDQERYPRGSETSIHRSSVREIRLENSRGRARVVAPFLAAAGAFGLTFLVAHRSNWYIDGRHGDLLLATAVGAPAGGAVLGYWLGRQLDHKTTVIMIVD